MRLTHSATRFLVGNSSALLLAIMLGAQAAHAEVVVEDPLALQFARARNMTIVRELADLPPDVDRILKQAFAMAGLAEIGESWNRTDVVSTSEPRAQFLYAALTEELAAVVLIGDGFGVSTRVILAERGATSYCHYTLGKFGSGFLMTGWRSTICQGTITLSGRRRGRRYPRRERQVIFDALATAQSSVARLAQACQVIGISARTVERWRKNPEVGDRRTGPHRRPCNALTLREITHLPAF